MSLACSIGIMAYNEEANIGQLLKALVTQRMSAATLSEIVVVASGCTDGTQAIVKAWCRRDSRVRLLVQAGREGKASAINYFLMNAKLFLKNLKKNNMNDDINNQNDINIAK